MTFVVCFVDGLEPREGEEFLDPRAEEINWNDLRGQSVRIIFERERDRDRALRAAAAHDCSIDVLDAESVDYSIVSYDTSDHRAAKKKLGMEIFAPILLPMPPHYALALLKEYRREISQPRRPRPMGTPTEGRDEYLSPKRPHRPNRRSVPAGENRRDAAVGDDAR
jgi:hypothetical protein